MDLLSTRNTNVRLIYFSLFVVLMTICSLSLYAITFVVGLATPYLITSIGRCLNRFRYMRNWLGGRRGLGLGYWGRGRGRGNFRNARNAQPWGHGIGGGCRGGCRGHPFGRNAHEENNFGRNLLEENQFEEFDIGGATGDATRTMQLTEKSLKLTPPYMEVKEENLWENPSGSLYQLIKIYMIETSTPPPPLRK